MSIGNCLGAYLGDDAVRQAIEFSIPPSDMNEALAAFAQQANSEIIFAKRDINGMRSPGVKGALTDTEALKILIDGSGLEFIKNDRDVIIVRRMQAASDQRNSIVGQITSIDKAARGNTELVAPTLASKDNVVVIGTNIRGVGNPASPVQIHQRATIERSGAATLQDYASLLPQNHNFSDTTAGGFAGPSSGLGGASAGINIRGLGESATLTLVNGRRVAPGGGSANFVDISLIPLSAVDSIEILTDGASAVYGADAVTGVVNFNLVNSIDGAETSLRFDSVTNGGLRQIQASQMIGTNWNHGQAFTGYEFLDASRLDSEDRVVSQEAADPTDLSPKRRRQSVVAGASMTVNDRSDIKVFGLYSDRNTSLRLSDRTFGANHETTSTEQFIANASGTYQLDGAWKANLLADYSRNMIEGQRFTENSLSLDAKARSTLSAAELMAEGPLWRGAAGDIRLATGFQLRSEHFFRSTKTVTEEVAERNRKTYAGFAELHIPIVGPQNTRAGIDKLAVTAAARVERISDSGTTTNPKVSLHYAPVQQIGLRATYGTSFQAPGLYDLARRQVALPLPAQFFAPPLTSDNVTGDVLVLSGGNPNLEPEKATTLTIGADFGSFQTPGFAVSFTYYDITFKNRISTPGGVLSQALAAPETFGDAITLGPDLNTVTSIFAGSDFSNPFAITPDAIGAIADNRLRNTAATHLNGVDLSLAYGKDSSLGFISARFDGSYIFEYDFQANSAQRSTSRLDTVYYPTDIRFRASLGISRDGLSSTAFINYVDGYKSIETGTPQSISSWATVDFDLTYEFRESSSSPWLQGMTLNLHAMNLFDEEPPFVDLGLDLGINFDGTNANARGRYISIALVKKW